MVGGSGGTGSVICEDLAKAGTDVAIGYCSNLAKAEEVAESVRAHGVKAELVQIDVREAAAIKRSVDELVSTHGRLHSVIIATGYDINMTMIKDLDPETWKQVFDNDVNGAFNIVHATLPHLKNGGGGSYVHISSAGLVRWPEQDVLSVAPKGAIQQLMKGISREEGGANIRANTIAIGVIDAGIFHRLKDTAFDEEWHENVQQGIALHRYGTASEVASTAVFLASSQAGYITGQTISCDGGWNL